MEMLFKIGTTIAIGGMIIGLAGVLLMVISFIFYMLQ